ncbi:MAG: LysM peptidoglycan-binding domain-containing protein [Chthoniobacteraceae bacterium]
MMFFPISPARALCVVFAITFCGCEQLFDKGKGQNLELAKKKAASGDYQGAITYYEASLDETADSADAHYRMASIYADKLRSPVDAMHHYGRYLRLAPNGPHAKEAKAYRKEGEQKLLVSLTKGNPITQQEAAKIRNENLELRNALATLRARKNATPPPLPKGVKKGEQVQKPIPPGVRTHVVKSGETLGKIAEKYYRSKARWKDIQDANFYALEGTAKIKPGMTLYIP